MSQLVTQTTSYGLNSVQYSISTLSDVGGVLEIMAGSPHDVTTTTTPIADFKSDQSAKFYGTVTAPSLSITADNAKVKDKNIVRSINGTVAGEDGDVVIEIATPVAQTVWSSTQRDAVLPAGTALTIPSYEMNTSKLVVYVDGLLLAKDRDYSEASTTSITFTFDLAADSVVTVIINQGAGGTVFVDESRSSVITAGTAYAVPSHEVGKLRVWLDGTACAPNIHFTNETETSVAFTSDIPKDMQIIIRIEG